MLLREQIRADLIVLDFRYFYAGMDWLSAYHARVDCFRKIVTQHLVNHRLNLLGCVMNIPLESRLFMPLHFWLHRVHGFHFGELSVLGLKDITYHRPFYMQDWGWALLY
jgi:Retroviral aspartyl protease